MPLCPPHRPVATHAPASGFRHAVLAAAVIAATSTAGCSRGTAVLPGDIRIAWRNGEARRDVAELWTEIGDILGQAGWPPVPARIKETMNVE